MPERHPSRRLAFAAAPLLIATALAPSVLALRTASVGEEAAEAAKAFADSLDTAQRKEAIFAFETDKRLAWHFIPKDDRKGVIFGELSDGQKQRLLTLGQGLLSDAGLRKTRGAMQLEALVAALEGEGRRWPRDPELYYVTLFGDPAAFGQPGQRWGFSFEGHHVSLNFTFEGTEVIDSTPQFLGAHPATVMDENALGLPKGYQLLGEEETLGFDLLASLSESQRSRAIIQDEPPAEVLTAGKPSPLEGAAAGLPAADMTDAQRATLTKLIGLYTEVVADPLANARSTAIGDSLDGVHFAWAGGDEPGEPHYYRIEGPSFEIELANTQPDAEGNPANHSHAMLRDNRGDFGLDR